VRCVPNVPRSAASPTGPGKSDSSSPAFGTIVNSKRCSKNGNLQKTRVSVFAFKCTPDVPHPDLLVHIAAWLPCPTFFEKNKNLLFRSPM
jgi:hypothetical protein